MDLSVLYKQIKIDKKPDPAISAKEEEERQEQKIIDGMIQQVVDNIKQEQEQGYCVTEFREVIPCTWGNQYSDFQPQLGGRISKVIKAFQSAGFRAIYYNVTWTYEPNIDYFILIVYWQEFDIKTCAQIENAAVKKV